jgi:hypothetical protein
VRRTAAAFAFIAVVAPQGCGSKSIVAPGITAAQLCARQDSLIAAQSPFPNINEIYDTIARLLPGGFGGLAVDALYLQQPALADTARATAAVLGACPGAQEPTLWAIIQTVPARRVSYSWLQLRAWLQQLLRGGTEGLVYAGIDVLGNRVGLGVRSQNDVDEFRSRARGLNIPEAALSVSVSGAAGAHVPQQPFNKR